MGAWISHLFALKPELWDNSLLSHYSRPALFAISMFFIVFLQMSVQGHVFRLVFLHMSVQSHVFRLVFLHMSVQSLAPPSAAYPPPAGLSRL